MATVSRWTGVEVRALRHASRMSLEAFAEYLGVSDRMISTWESRGATMRIRQANQAALDTALSTADSQVHSRFITLIAETDSDLVDNGSGQDPSFPEVSISRMPHDGREMALIRGGVFLAGENREPVWLPDFHIDVHPVTNADYERFIAATGATPPQHWQGDTPSDAIRDHPAVWVTWHDAAGYAIWAGKRLPTAHEWEKAARGPGGDVYPWGDQPTPAKCNTRESGIRSTTPVTRYLSGASAYGVHDMCGNTWEWTRSRSASGRYELKGGAWTSPFTRATPSTFNDADTTMLDDDTGFRCARDVTGNPAE